MLTQEALQRFYKHCRDKNLSPRTIQGYDWYLRHLADEYPELPTDAGSIERFLKARKEGPGHRGTMFKRVQAFYSYLAKEDNIPSPVPARGPMGRPRKDARRQDLRGNEPAESGYPASGKVVEGGYTVARSISISTSTACRAFLKRREVSGCSERTVVWYLRYLRRFAVMFPTVPLDSLKLDRYLATVPGGSLNRHGAARTLVTFYHFLEETNQIPRGVLKVPRIKQENKVRRILTRDELQSLWRHTLGYQERCILNTLIDTKCRAGEMLSLTRENIFPDHALVKGKVGERVIPLTLDTYHMLCELAPAGPLFTVEGRPMSIRYLQGVVHELMLRAGLTGKKLGPHILRHTAATEHIMAGGDMMSLQQELGHTTPTMTAVYGRLAAGQLTEKHQQLDLLHRLMPAQEHPGATAVALEALDEPITVGIKGRKLE